jgi:chemotaxis protein MotB
MMWAGRAAIVVAMAAMVSASVGCQQQQLEERNAALQKQFEQAMASNSELSAENEQLKSDNQRLNGDVARLSTRAGTAVGPTGTAARPRGPVPNFGEGIDVSMAGEAMTIRLPEAVLFAPGQALILPAAQKALDKIADHLKKQYAKARTRVEGHTDNQPIVKTKALWFDNLDLSSNRAMAVERYLVSKGVDPKQIYAAGFGDTHPLASNDSAPGRAKNRRVEIVVIP